MGNWIQGVHHIAIKCDSTEMFQKTLDFYGRILGLQTVRTWGEGSGAGAMLAVGSSLMEIFASGRTSDCTGTVNHIAFAVKDVDGCLDAIRKEGYRVTMEPNDIVIGSVPPLPARIAFCVGPAGEEIELFCET